ncbi:DUF2683 family protein [Pedobacter glucosidilyticus]|uniref:DUF2683 family protein n=1 Tax=Pedobacter glucosidilyticus TaxID=1122941 RepID=UPI00040A0406|nr:DUF2683 family protein [Pedobacter glucosidilyticus]
METLIVHPENKEQLAAIKAFMKALKISFEKKSEESPYNPEFVQKILAGRDDIKNGKGVKINPEDLWK